MKAKAVLLTAIVALLVASSAATASPPEVGHFSGQDTFGPQVISDLPCLEGQEFVLAGGVNFRGNFVNSEQFFHFAGIERHFGTLVPVDGQGPTYVESGNADRVDFTARAVPAGVELVQTHVNNDRFVAYVNGKVVASATIRIHEVEHFRGLDTDGDNVPDEFKVSVVIDHVSCPA
jgi:hypothetical protein